MIFNWVLFGLAVFGLVMVFDPLGSKRYHEVQETPSAGESLRHRKGTSIWKRRFRWAFCWVRSDEHGHEAFQQVWICWYILICTIKERIFCFAGSCSIKCVVSQHRFGTIGCFGWMCSSSCQTETGNSRNAQNLHVGGRWTEIFNW